MTNDLETFSAASSTTTQTAQSASTNPFLQHDGTNPKAALSAGLQITAICIVGIAVILTLYYASLRLLAAAFPPKPEGGAESDDD